MPGFSRFKPEGDELVMSLLIIEKRVFPFQYYCHLGLDFAFLQGGCPVHSGIFSSILGPYLQEISNEEANLRKIPCPLREHEKKKVQ